MEAGQRLYDAVRRVNAGPGEERRRKPTPPVRGVYAPRKVCNDDSRSRSPRAPSPKRAVLRGARDKPFDVNTPARVGVKKGVSDWKDDPSWGWRNDEEWSKDWNWNWNKWSKDAEGRSKKRDDKPGRTKPQKSLEHGRPPHPTAFRGPNQDRLVVALIISLRNAHW